ncbi:MAG: hypothetical protein LLG04_15340 [Parachlamydia sp.]|nr:hypothetical protein [Parachlamydia sp.]
MARSFYNMFILTVLMLETGLSAGWSNPETVGPDNSVSPWLAVDNQGNAIALFIQSDSSNTWIAASKRPAGGQWSAPVAISQSIPLVEFPYFYPSVTFNETGDAIAVWNFPDEKMIGAIQVATLPAGTDQWITAAEPLTKPARIEFGPAIRQDGEDNVLIIWMTWHKRSGHFNLHTMRFNITSMQGKSLTTVEGLLGVTFWDVAIDLSGNAYMIWLESPDNRPVPSNVKVASLTSGDKSWSEPQVLVENGSVYSCDLAIDPNGNVFALWKQQDSSSNPWELKIFKHPAGGSAWEEAPAPQGSVFFLGYEKLAFDAAGNGYVVWQTKENGFPVAFSKLPFDSNTWIAPIKVMPVGDSMRMCGFGVDKSGNALFFWEDADKELLKASTLPSGNATWTQPVTLASGNLGMSWPFLASTQQEWIILYAASDSPANLVNALIGIDLFQEKKIQGPPLKECPCRKWGVKPTS